MLELIKNTRSYRRFREDVRIEESTLKTLVEAARYSPSAANLQRLRFALVTDVDSCQKLRSMLSFAGYLSDWGGPSDGECPAAYIVILTEKTPDTNLAIDIGIAAQSMLLTARSMGLGGCMFRSFSREGLTALLPIEGYAPELVIALGVPKETVVTTEMKDGDVRYFRDEEDRHVVPKRSLDELILSPKN